MADPTVEEVDAFIEGYKTLDGFLPDWEQSFGWDWNTRWGILDLHGRQQAELVFTINAALTHPSICAIYRKKLIYRVDIVPMTEMKPNDYGALALGLPAYVTGPHTHPWPEHREFVRLNGFGELPFRKAVDIVDVQFIRALEVASADLNIHVEPRQRECEPPRQAALFADRLGL